MVYYVTFYAQKVEDVTVGSFEAEREEMDPAVDTRAWLIELTKQARVIAGTEVAMILSWQPLLEDEPTLEDRCSRCLWWVTRWCPDSRPAPGSQKACGRFTPKP
jgi:hypothetical protein